MKKINLFAFAIALLQFNIPTAIAHGDRGISSLAEGLEHAISSYHLVLMTTIFAVLLLVSIYIGHLQFRKTRMISRQKRES